VAIRDDLDALNNGFGEAFATQDAARLAAIYAAAFACRPAEHPHARVVTMAGSGR